MRKILFVIAGVFLASFAMARVDGVGAHRGFGGSIAWAQSWDDADSGESIDTAAPPNISGNYTGMAQDHRFGAGSISIDLSQTGSKVSGTWSTDLEGGLEGTVSGQVRPNSKVHLKLKITGLKHCTINFQGTFENGDELAGVYENAGCRQSDHGMVQVTD